MRAVLRSTNPEARVYAAHFLAQLGPLDPRDEAAIAALARLPVEIETSQGCVLERLTWSGVLAVLAV